MIVRESSEFDRETHKNALFFDEDHIRFIRNMLEKVVSKLSKLSRPNRLITLQKDI